jgi:hypothetical protein
MRHAQPVRCSLLPRRDTVRTLQPPWAFSDERFEEVKDDTDHTRNDVSLDPQGAGEIDRARFGVRLIGSA